MEKPLSRLGDLEEAEQIASRTPLPSAEYTGSRYQTAATSTQILYIRGEWGGGTMRRAPRELSTQQPSCFGGGSWAVSSIALVSLCCPIPSLQPPHGIPPRLLNPVMLPGTRGCEAGSELAVRSVPASAVLLLCTSRAAQMPPGRPPMGAARFCLPEGIFVGTGRGSLKQPCAQRPVRDSLWNVSVKSVWEPAESL